MSEASPAIINGQTRKKMTQPFSQAQSNERHLQATIASLTEQLQIYTGKLQDQQRETSRLGQELPNWHDDHPTPAQGKLTENQQECSLIIKRQKSEALLRCRDRELTFGDLSNELLVLVLGVLDYVDQQRIARVCRRWKYLINSMIDHIFLDWPAIEARRRLGDYRIFQGYFFRQTFKYNFPIGYEHRLTKWQHQSNVIRRVTFHAGFRKDYTLVFRRVLRLIKQFSQLTVLTLYKAPLDGLAVSMVGCDFNGYWQEAAGQLQVNTVDCVVSAFSETNRGPDWTIPFGPFYLHLLGDRLDSCLSVEDAVFADFDGLEGWLLDGRHTWPYPGEQMTWLQQQVTLLDDTSDVVVGLQSVINRAPYHQLVSTDFLCPEHRLFCSHLDQSFYDKMSGAGRNLIIAFLLQFKLPQVPWPPAFPLKHKRLLLDDQRKCYTLVDRP